MLALAAASTVPATEALGSVTYKSQGNVLVVGADERAEFDALDDCVERIHEFLAQPERVRAIAERAHARVVRDHLYRHRAMRLIDFARNARRT